MAQNNQHHYSGKQSAGYQIQGPEEQIENPYYDPNVYDPNTTYDPAQQYHGTYYYHNNNNDQEADDDAQNYAEIEQELNQAGYDQQQYQQYEGGGAGAGGYQEEDAQHYEEIEAAIIAQESHLYDDNAVPVGSGGKLTAHAAEFWFPESRDCACCKGFKHGCSCIHTSSSACQKCLPAATK